VYYEGLNLSARIDASIVDIEEQIGSGEWTMARSAATRLKYWKGIEDVIRDRANALSLEI
jgi:hypothetical protein